MCSGDPYERRVMPFDAALPRSRQRADARKFLPVSLRDN
jgi:hypothetical protein